MELLEVREWFPILSSKLKLSKTNKSHLISHLSKFFQPLFLPKKKWRFLLYHILIQEQQDRFVSYKCYQLTQANVPDTLMWQRQMCAVTHFQHFPQRPLNRQIIL